MAINISLSQFIDFTTKQSMVSKIKKVDQIKNQHEHSFYYWKDFREAVKEYCLKQDKTVFNNLLSNINPKKYNTYFNAVNSFQKMLKGKNVQWIEPPTFTWCYNNELIVSATPDLGLIINGKNYLIRTFYNEDSSTINKRNIIPSLTLLNNSIVNEKTSPDTIIGLFNLNTSRFYPIDNEVLYENIPLKYEALLLVNIWNASLKK
ncbi:hypothetical protein [Gottfriedia acidiceleris]|uniref:Uncharacterized protein n=1 Tax=Gottfriedia acidiceleris TaxID=371036 RepID=A0ABY4JHR7_9BACI|nr:hypothetical protein [Gottfriedia acidiceleris]UPM52443.1 hypothetical protein MY490_11360 [Gottfriedia acidiceleris]